MRSFDFIGFEPSSALRSFAAARFGLVDSEAPSDSSASAQVAKTLDGFKAILQIRSAVGTFVDEVVAEDPQEAIRELCTRIRSQLMAWKQTRFGF